MAGNVAPSCSVCRIRNGIAEPGFVPGDYTYEARVAWGCLDGTTAEEPIQTRSMEPIRVPCECGGSAPDCECEGSGWRALDICPNRYLRESLGERELELINWFSLHWRKAGIMPAAGGLMDQAALFCQAMTFLTATANEAEAASHRREMARINRGQ